MKVCVIGNSHAAALRMGWTQLKSAYSVELEFFAAPRSGMVTLQQRDGALYSDNPAITKHMRFTSGGKDVIEMAEYDAFVLTLGAGLKALFNTFRSHRTVAMSSRVPLIHAVSDELARRMVESQVRSDLSNRVLRMIRAVRDVPVVIAETPMPTEGIRVGDPKSVWNDAEVMAPILDRLLLEVPRQENAPTVRQPASTLEGWFTKDEFSRNSVGLVFDGREHDEGEPHHMNAVFGSLMLEQVFSVLAVR